MNENKVLTEYDRLIRNTVKIYAKKIDQSRTCNTLEDFLQEGRIAALKAIRSYDKDLKTKLSTYIVNCVKNRIRDLHRNAHALRIPPSDITEDMTMHSVKGDTDLIDTRMTLKYYLESEDFKMIAPVLQDGCTVPDLIRDLQEERLVHVKNKYNRRKIMRESREDVVSCLCQVQRVLGLKGVSRRSKTSLSLVR